MVITRKELEELTDFRKDTGYTVSVYLNTDRKDYPRREYLTSLKDLLRKAREEAVRRQLSKEHLEPVLATLAQIQDYADKRFERADNKGLAVFASGEKGLFKAFPLPVAVKDEVRLEPDPYLQPLTAVLAGQKKLGTILLDHSRARIFETYLGRTEEIAQIEDEVPGQVKTSGWRGYGEGIHKKTDDLVAQHIRNVCRKAASLSRERRFDLLVIGGLPELACKLADQLPAELKTRLAGTCNLSVTATAAQVQARSLEMEASKEEEDVWNSLPKQS